MSIRLRPSPQSLVATIAMTQAGTAGIQSARRVSCRHQPTSADLSEILAVIFKTKGGVPRRSIEHLLTGFIPQCFIAQVGSAPCQEIP